tara:strand:- start:267 stop:602 length:336 start_codon:yes stop_codon:yes gene_type:complete
MFNILMALISTKGFEVLEEQDKLDFDKLINEYAVKIERKVKNLDNFIIHLKEYKKLGNQKKFSIHVRIADSYKVFEADAADWDFKRTLHKVFNKLDSEIEHRFHTSDQHKK